MKNKIICILVLVCFVFNSQAQTESTITFKHEEAGTSLIGIKIETPLSYRSDGSIGLKMKTPIEFTSYAIGWKTSTNYFSPGEFEIYTRVHHKELGWSKEFEDHGYTHPDDNIRELYLSDLLFGLDQWLHDSVEFYIVPPIGASIEEVHLILQDMSAQTSTERLPKEKDIAAPSKSCPELPPIVPRSDWCGSYEDCHNPPNIPPDRYPTHVVVHYGGSTGEYTDGYAVVRSYWNYHVNTKGWWDIGYNYLFDKYGNLFQGRHNENIPYQDVRGVHAGNAHANDNSIGVCFLKNTDIIGVTTEQMNTAYQFMAWWFNHKGFDPLSSAYIAGGTYPRICGHKDVSDASTSCPGVLLTDMMPTIRTSVRQVIDDCDCFLNPGRISGNQTICAGSSPEEFTGIVLTGNPGDYSYQWQIQSDCTGEWEDIQNATGQNYTHGTLPNNACFRRKVIIDDCATKYSVSETGTMEQIIAWYPLNEDVSDYSGNDITATNFGATWTTNMLGENNTALQFNGSTNYIGLPPTNEIFGVTSGSNISNVTIAARIFIASGDLNENRRIIATYASESSTAFGFIVNTSSKVVAYGPSDGRKIYINGVETDDFVVNQWQHVVVTYPGTSTVIAKNSEIGRWSGTGYESGTNYMNGKLDDIRIYNKVLSFLEIEELYNSCPASYIKVTTEFCDGPPVVETNSVTDITPTTAKSGGNVTHDGGSTVTARGIVWSSSQNPTTQNNEGITYNGTGTGSFTSDITGLIPDNTYFVRAYATNNEGTGYGEQISFSTLDCNINPGIISEDQLICSGSSPEEFTGNLPSGGIGAYSYQWQIQSGCTGAWTDIQNATEQNYNHGMLTDDACFRRIVTNVCGEGYSISSGGTMEQITAWYPFNGDILDYSGNNHQATNIGATWTTNMFGSNNSALQFNGSSNYIELPHTNEIFGVTSGSNITGATVVARVFIASGDLSESRRIIATYAAEGSTAFGFIVNTSSKVVAYGPSDGRKIYVNGVETDDFTVNQWQHIVVTYPGTSAVISRNAEIGRWSGTGYASGINYMKGKVDDVRIYNKVLSVAEINELSNSYSNPYITVTTEFCEGPPIIETNSITDIAPTTAKSGGHIINDGGSSVTARGIVWSTSQNPTIGNNQGITSDGTGIGIFTSNLTGLTPETTYYVRAYATNNNSTAYGQQLSFTTGIEDFNVYIELSDHYNVTTNNIVTVIMSVSGLPEDEHPLGIQGSIKFNTEILEYQGYVGYQLQGGSLSVSSVSGQPDTKTIFWSTEHGSSTVTNGNLVGLQFLYKGTGETCTNIIWTGDPLAEMIIDGEWNEIEAKWNTSEICGTDVDGYTVSGTVKYAGSVNVSSDEPVYNNPIYNLDNVIVILETPMGVEIGRDTTNVEGVFIIDNITNEGDYVLKYNKLNNDYYKWIYSGTGINAADVGIFRTHILNPYNLKFRFDDFYLNAMDFNDDGSLNASDVSMLQTKIVNPFNPDYIDMQNFLPHGTWMGSSDQITINSNITNYQCVLIAYGDYNASATAYMYNDFSTHNWGGGKSDKTDDFIIETEDILIVKENTFTLPVHVIHDYQNNFGYQLELAYPSDKFMLKSAKINIDNSFIDNNINLEMGEILNSEQDFLVTDIDGVIRILYISPPNASFDISSDENLLNLEFEKINNQQSIDDFYLTGHTSLIATSDFDVISPVNLKIPKLTDGTSLVTDSELFRLQVYPNPAKDIIYVQFDVFKIGLAEISLIDVLGREVKKLENKNLIKGQNKFEFNVSDLTSGLYTVRINYNNETTNEIINIKMIVK